MPPSNPQQVTDSKSTTSAVYAHLVFFNLCTVGQDMEQLTSSILDLSHPKSGHGTASSAPTSDKDQIPLSLPHLPKTKFHYISNLIPLLILGEDIVHHPLPTSHISNFSMTSTKHTHTHNRFLEYVWDHPGKQEPER